MRHFFALLLAALALGSPPCFAGPDKSLLSARETLLSSSATGTVSAASTPQTVLVKYAAASKKTISAPVTAEYAYALACAGLPEAALYNIDRALINEPLNAEVRFYLSEVFNAFGLEDASAEVAAPVPAWLKTPKELPALELAAPAGGFESAFASINLLMTQKRYAQSVVLFDRLCKTLPEDGRCRAGYAIALEKLGAYKAAVIQAEKDLELTRSLEHKKLAADFIADLEKRPALKYSAPVKPLKGRYLAFLGGNLSHAGGDTLYAFSTRAGKFISERLDISANAAISGGNPISDYNGLTLGVSSRYNQPLGYTPVNATLAAKIENIPAPGKDLAFLVSPGVSYFMKDSSLDMFWDVALSGKYSGSVTMSIGYTVYFGGGQ